MRARRAEILLLLVTAVWGLTFPIIKDALADAAPLAFVSLRFGLAALVLAPLLAGPLRVPSRGAARAGVGLGALIALGYGLQALGLERTTASKSGFLTGMNVLLVPFLAWLWEGERPSRGAFLGTLSAAAGTALLLAPRDLRLNTGDLLTLGCAAAFGLEVVALQIASRRHGGAGLVWPAILTTALLSGAAAIFIPASSDAPLVRFTPRLLLAIAVTGLLATAAAHAIRTHWQKETSSVRAAIIYATEPLFALLFAAILLGERLPPAGLAGGAAILAGLLIAQLDPRRAAGRADGQAAPEGL